MPPTMPPIRDALLSGGGRTSPVKLVGNSANCNVAVAVVVCVCCVGVVEEFAIAEAAEVVTDAVALERDGFVVGDGVDVNSNVAVVVCVRCVCVRVVEEFAIVEAEAIVEVTAIEPDGFVVGVVVVATGAAGPAGMK